MLEDTADKPRALPHKPHTDLNKGCPARKGLLGLSRRFDVAVGYDGKLGAGSGVYVAYLLDTAGFYAVYVVEKAIIHDIVYLFEGNGLRNLDDYGLVSVV